MIFKDNFSELGANSSLVFKQLRVPVFQNKVYRYESEALNAPNSDVELVQSNNSGFIFNRLFNQELMIYDQNYQNEQANSESFKQHLKTVLDLLKSFGLGDKKVVEVGCGKGVFFELLLSEGIDCWGFDPTYEGNNPRIEKDYFSARYKDVNADVIIMRHTLEHIPKPFTFLHTIAKANNYKGYLYVEVPTFDWIVEKQAFWDIFYEHCNYFTEQSLSVMFSNATTGNFFGGQYIYLWADLSKLKPSIISGEKFIKRQSLIFQDKINYYRDFLNEKKNLAIWGAGAKGSTFLNLLDPKKQKVKYVIDINPVKQNKFIAGTGHPIYPSSILDTIFVDNVLVMNENYLDEIRLSIGARNINILQSLKLIMEQGKIFEAERVTRIEENGKNKNLRDAASYFMNESIKSGYSYNFSWMGRPIIQYPQDMVVMQELIWEIQPDLIIETGVAHGGSIIFYASLLELIGKGEIIGIDIDIREHNRREIEDHPMSKRIKLIQGSSVDDGVLKRINNFTKGKSKIIVCLDSNHTHEHVIRELNLYSQFVTLNSYLVVFDTIVEDLPSELIKERPWSKGNNPKTAVSDFLKTHTEFAVDHSIDNKLMISVAPGGYLKRII